MATQTLYIRTDVFKIDVLSELVAELLYTLKTIIIIIIRQGIKLVKNNVDCLVWIKLEKNFFSIEEDIYIGITYIAPENSRIHDIYSVDIFKTIQDDTSFFLRHGKVFLLGDLNSRTSTQNGLYRT